jgi:LysR family transcriptional regulator, glycine cleavage system transcriptional activator
MAGSSMSVTLNQLTSLDLIRGFVAVGRRMSITLAADDLCLTQSAVSRQIRTLEDMLGVKLFVRGHRSIVFTSEGERLFRRADEALKQLQDVVGAVRVGLAMRPVTIAASIGVTGLWLLPRLGNFLQHHPNIDVRISASNELSDLRNEELDLAIRYCPPEAAPPHATRLFGETVAPVAHPSLKLGALESADELRAQVLLEFDGEYRPWLRWNEWLASQGWEGVKPKAMLRFNQYDQTIHAAMAAQGIALGRLELIGSALGEGRLVKLRMPRPGPVTSNAYWLICGRSAHRPEVDDVVEWIRAEANDTVK